ncbi:LysE family translocator [Elusimicrobiota bacterium]
MFSIESKFLIGGLIIGFAGVAPLGPVGVLCIQRMLTRERVIGIASVLGASLGNIIYGCIAGFGIKLIAGFFLAYPLIFQLIGSCTICFVGYKTAKRRANKPPTGKRSKNIASAFVSMFLLTLANPILLVTFGAFFAVLGIAHAQANYVSVGELIFGILIGAILSWSLMTFLCSALNINLTEKHLLIINRICGIIVIGFGFLILIL